MKAKRLERIRQKVSRELSKTALVIFIALVILLALQYIFVWSFLQNYETYLIIAAVIFGVLTFWLNRGKINLESEIKKEELEEAGRKKEFSRKFPKISRIRGIRWLVRWMYKEGWLYSVGLILLVIIGFTLRIWNLDNLCPYTDGYLHIGAATDLMESGLTDYTRGLPYTYLVYFSFNAFGVSEWAARIPGVIIGSIVIFIIYIVAKYFFDKNTALLASTLYTFLPWSIGVARDIRMYEMFQLFFLLSVLYLFKTIEEKPQFAVYNQPKRLAFIANLVSIKYLLVLITLIVISYFVHQETLSIGFIAGGYIFCLFLFTTVKNLKTRDIKHSVANKYGILLLCLLLLMIPLYFIFKGDIEYYLGPELTVHGQSLLRFITLFNFSALLLGVGIVAAVTSNGKKGFYIALIFSLLVLMHCFFFQHYHRPRYVYYLLPYFLMLSSYGFYAMFALVTKSVSRMKGNQRFKKLAKNATPIMFILVFLIAIVPIGKALGVPYWEHGENPTGEVHDDFRTALNSVTIRPADALICTLDGPLDLYQSISSKKYTKNVAYNSSNFVSAVKDNAHGYFFPDYRRFEIWSCEQYVPCFIRELTWTYFIYHEEASEKAIYVYIFEWNTLQPNSSSESYQGDHPQVHIVNAFASEEDENIQVDLQISSGFTDSSELFILEICNEEGDKLNHFFVNLPNNSVSDYNFDLITESIIGNSGLLSFTLSYVDPIGEKIVEITTYDAPVR